MRHQDRGAVIWSLITGIMPMSERAVCGVAWHRRTPVLLWWRQGSVHDELRPHVPVRITPWERYGTAAAASIAALLDREEAERSRPLGRALDLGCGRGQYTPELARRGWEAVGIDYVPAATEAAAAKSRCASAVAGAERRTASLGCFCKVDLAR